MLLRGNSTLKAADRFVGVPLVRLIGLRAKRARPSTVSRIGVLRTAAIGDTLLLTGILRDLRSAFPDADIVLFTGKDNAEAGDLAVYGLGRRMMIAPEAIPFAVATLRAENLDVLIDTGSWPRLDAVLTALSGATYCVGFQTPGQDRHFAYDAVATHSDRVHEVHNYRTLVRAIGIAGQSDPAVSRAALPDVPVETPGFIVFHPWSGGFRGDLREWPMDRWVNLANCLRTLDVPIIITGASADAPRSRQLANLLLAAGARAESAAGRYTLAQLGTLLCSALGVISTNTGVMHLSALLGVATVSLNGPTASHRWGPVGARVRSVASTLPGCGFLNLGFEYDGHRTDCMQGIDARAVADTFQQLISS